MLEFPPFRLDKSNQCIWRCGGVGEEQRVVLKPKAFEVLSYLVDHAGRLVTQEELLRAVWPNTFVQPEVLKRQIFDIRTGLGDDPKKPRFIETLSRRGYRFIGVARNQSERAEDDRLPKKIVGRTTVLAQLQSHFLKSLAGRRQIVFVTGETGIGKSAVVEEFVRQPSANSEVRVGRGECLEGYSGKEPYYPVLQALGSLCRGPEGNTAVEIMAAHAPTWLVQFPALLERQRRDTLQREISGETRQRMLREMGDALEKVTAEAPLLLILEDLHWVDHSTVDLISAIARGRAPAKLMLVGTYRSGHAALFGHPLDELKQNLLVRQLCYEVPLRPLSETEIEAYLLRQSPDGLPKGLVELLQRYSEGNPLFLVAALEHLNRRGFLARTAGGWKANLPIDQIDLEIPDSLGTMIEAQLDHLAPEHRRVAEVASVVGTSFCSALASCAGDIDPELFEQTCERFCRLEQIVRPAGNLLLPDGTTSRMYAFAHAVVREVVYRGQPSALRAALHLRIAEHLEQWFTQKPSEVAPMLAEHFERGGDWLRAIRYLLLSAGTVPRYGAQNGAEGHLRRVHDLIDRLPEAERKAIKIDMLAQRTSERA